MILREWSSPDGPWLVAEWRDAVLEDDPDTPARHKGRWLKATDPVEAWIAPDGEVVVIGCDDPELEAAIEESVGRRAERWAAEWRGEACGRLRAPRRRRGQIGAEAQGRRRGDPGRSRPDRRRDRGDAPHGVVAGRVPRGEEREGMEEIRWR